MRFTFSGGAMEVGGSCIYLKLDDHGILLDSGIRQGSVKDPLPDFRAIQQAGGVEAIVISHAHMDHIGTLPLISKAYPEAPIFMNAMTLDLTRVLLQDSLKIMERRDGEIPVYSEVDVKNMMDRVRTVRLQYPWEILPGIRLTQYPAGHIAGAACILLQGQEGTVFYSGDVSSFPQQTIDGARIPKLRPDVAILESTYGNRLHANRQAEELRLVEAVADCVKNGGKVLIPAFALGRAQEVLLILRKAMQNKSIPEVPVYVDGMVRDICRVYKLNPTYLRGTLAKRILKGQEPFYNEQIQPVQPAQNRNELVEKTGPAVFVSSSGMLSGGPSVQYAEKLAGQENACILLTGYQDEESPGRALLNLLEETDTEQRRITLDGISIPVRCRVEQMGLSAHGDQSELSNLMNHLSPRHVMLVHGNEEAISELSRDLAREWKRKIYLPRVGESIEIRLRNKREQLKTVLPETMRKKEPPAPEDCEQFWDFWTEKYPKRSMTAEQIAFMWYGRSLPQEETSEDPEPIREEDVEELVRILLESPYFQRDFRRMYLITSCSEDEIRENIRSREITVQEVELFVRKILTDMDLKKIGFHTDQKAAVVTVDFPDVVSAETVAKADRDLFEQTGWRLKLNPAMNFHRANLLIETLFAGRTEKISYYSDRHCFEVTLKTAEEDDSEKKGQFRQTTGWDLIFHGEAAPERSTQKDSVTQTAPDMYWVLPVGGRAPKEQNEMLMIVEACFADTPVKPYKKGIKSDAEGHYLELSFMTPALGLRCRDVLIRSAEETRWRVHISESVNQQALMICAQTICERNGIVLKKNPSYLPSDRSVQVQTEVELPDEMLEEFMNETGSRLKRKE